MFDKRLISMVPGAMRCIVADVAFQWVALVTNIALFLLIGSFVQNLVEGAADGAALATLLAAGAAAIVVCAVCQTLAQRMGQRAAAKAKQAVRQQVYDKLVRLGPAYREHVATSEAVQIGVEGTEQLESYFGQYLPQPFYAVLAPLTLFAVLAPLSLPPALTLFVLVPLIPLSIVAVMRIAKRVMRTYWGSYTDFGGSFLENIQGLTTLKIYRADEERHRRMNEQAEGFRRATMRLLRMQLNSITIMDLFAFGGAAVGIVMVLGEYAAGAVAFGTAFSIVFLSAEFFLPLRTLGSFFHTAMNGMAAAERMYAILDVPEAPRGTRSIDASRPDIACRGVGYSYDGERTVLANADATQEDVDQAAAMLAAARDALVEAVTADLDELRAFVDKVDGLDPALYTPESWSAFSEALAAAQALLVDDATTQNQADAALASLQEAYGALMRADVDTQALEELVSKAEGLKASDYSQGTWADLEAALEAAREVLADPQASQSDVDDALAALQAAIDDLQKADGENVVPAGGDRPSGDSDRKGASGGNGLSRTGDPLGAVAAGVLVSAVAAGGTAVTLRMRRRGR